MNTTLPARRISAGGFIRIEALEELGLSVAAAGRILGERRAILSDLVKGVVPRGAANDAAHIAIAAASGVDFLVTWNFRHIANASLRTRINQACLEAGYDPPIICTPSELMEVPDADTTD